MKYKKKLQDLLAAFIALVTASNFTAIHAFKDCTMDPTLIAPGALVKVTCDKDDYTGIFSFKNEEYVSVAGYLLIAQHYGRTWIGADGKLKNTWKKEDFERQYPILTLRNRKDLKEYESDSEIFQLASEIEEETGIQINYGKDNEFALYSDPLYDNEKLSQMMMGILEFAKQYPIGFFKTVLPGICITLTAKSVDLVGANEYTLANTTFDNRRGSVSSRFHIELTALNKHEKQIIQVLNHELGHVIDYMLNDASYNMTTFKDVIERLNDPSSLYQNQHGVNTNKEGHKDFQYPDLYSQHNEMEYIGRLFEYRLTSGYDFLFKEDSFYSEQARLVEEKIADFDPLLSSLLFNHVNSIKTEKY